MGTPAHMRPAMWSCGPLEGCLRHGPGSCPTSPFPCSLGGTARSSTDCGTPNWTPDHSGTQYEVMDELADPLMGLG